MTLTLIILSLLIGVHIGRHRNRRLIRDLRRDRNHWMNLADRHRSRAVHAENTAENLMWMLVEEDGHHAWLWKRDERERTANRG